MFSFKDIVVRAFVHWNGFDVSPDMTFCGLLFSLFVRWIFETSFTETGAFRPLFWIL